MAGLCHEQLGASLCRIALCSSRLTLLLHDDDSGILKFVPHSEDFESSSDTFQTVRAVCFVAQGAGREERWLVSEDVEGSTRVVA